MLTRLHISSFVGLTIIVWLLALWFQGMPVLNADFLKPFGTVVGVIAIFLPFLISTCGHGKSLRAGM